MARFSDIYTPKCSYTYIWGNKESHIFPRTLLPEVLPQDHGSYNMMRSPTNIYIYIYMTGSLCGRTLKPGIVVAPFRSSFLSLSIVYRGTATVRNDYHYRTASSLGHYGRCRLWFSPVRSISATSALLNLAR